MFVSNIEGLSYDNGRMVPLPKSSAPLESFMISLWVSIIQDVMIKKLLNLILTNLILKNKIKKNIKTIIRVKIN